MEGASGGHFIQPFCSSRVTLRQLPKSMPRHGHFCSSVPILKHEMREHILKATEFSPSCPIFKNSHHEHPTNSRNHGVQFNNMQHQDSHIYRYASLQKERKQRWGRERAKSSEVIYWVPAGSADSRRASVLPGDAHLELEGNNPAWSFTLGTHPLTQLPKALLKITIVSNSLKWSI